MKDIEEQLEQATLREPGQRLEVRMSALFNAPRRTQNPMMRPIPAWACALLMALSALLVRELSRLEGPGTPSNATAGAPASVKEVIYVIQPVRAVPGNVFDFTVHAPLDDPFFEHRIVTLSPAHQGSREGV